jgi:hypothetical protein
MPQVVGAEPVTVGAGGAGSPERWCRRDSIFACFMVGVPAALLSLAALIGYPLITGDDLIQNFPLEELAGHAIAEGHWPLYDPYLWSGTPLLGGANAHALLPITLLFAVMPPLAAWVLGEVIVIAAAALGCQLFLRRTGCGPLAAALGGATFGLGGFVSSQMVHIDFVAAAAALPWALVALDGLACRSPNSRRRHCMLLCAATAWVALTGSPDIVVDAIVVCGSFALHLLIAPRSPSRGDGGRDGGADLRLRTTSRWAFFGWSALGCVAGVAIGALQWWPAALFIGISQRSHPSFGFISAGSLSWGNLLQLLVPHLLGGGPIGLRNYAGTFQLAEMDAYPGMLALIAVAVMLTRIRRPGARRWRVWLVVAAVGIALSLGSHTPLEHVIARLPVLSEQRLPSRALITFALAVSLLFGYFLDQLLEPRTAGTTSTTTRTGRRIGRREAAAAFVPVAGVLSVVIATVVTGKPAGGALTAQPGSGWSVGAVAPALVLSVMLSLGAFLVFVLWPLRPGGSGFADEASGSARRRARWRGWAVALVLVDLSLFVANQSSLAPAPVSVLDAHGPLESRLAALAGSGRALVVDPDLAESRSLAEVGCPDLGVLSELPEAGGYSSVVWGRYSTRTGTHTEDGASTAALADGTFAQLGVRVVLVLHKLAALRSWVPAGRVGPFLAFLDPHPAPPYAVRSSSRRSVSPSVVHVLSSSPLTGAASVKVVSPVSATLTRSVADIPGWHVTVRHAGRVSSPAVRLAGLVQSVRIPAGASVVSFSYVPPGWRAALLSATGGALVVAGLAMGGLGGRRRRRRRAKAQRQPGGRPLEPVAGSEPALSGAGAPSSGPQ